MELREIVEWTKSKLSELAGHDVPVTSSETLDTLDALTTGTVAMPELDLCENEKEYRVVVDAPGATAPNRGPGVASPATVVVGIPGAAFIEACRDPPRAIVSVGDVPIDGAIFDRDRALDQTTIFV